MPQKCGKLFKDKLSKKFSLYLFKRYGKYSIGQDRRKFLGSRAKNSLTTYINSVTCRNLT